MPDSDRNRTGRALGLLIGGSLVLLSGVIFFAAWFVGGANRVTVQAFVPADLPRTESLRQPHLDRNAALAMIPAAGQTRTSQTACPDECVTAAQATQLALADPASLARAGGDSRLAACIEAWEGRAISRKGLVAFADQFAQAVDSSPLAWNSLFQVGTAFNDLARDPTTTTVIYTAAFNKADAQLRGLSPGSSEAQPILMAMNDARRLLWDAFDNYRDQDALATLAGINSDIAKWAASGDPLMDDARNHANIGVPECLYATGDMSRAIPLLMALDTKSMTANEKLGVWWIRGLALFHVGQYDQAARQLQSVADDPSYQYSEGACHLLEQCLVRLGRTNDAISLQELVARRYTQ
jgi:tetratricopeptide (TPR) repeat protein